MRGVVRKEIEKVGGIYVYMWQIQFVVQQKITQPCKAVIHQLKINTEQEISKMLKKKKRKEEMDSSNIL